MDRPVSIRKIVFLVCFIQVGAELLRDDAGDIGESLSQCPNSYLNKDLSWFRQNAQTLLFMEHLQQRASQENLFDWPKEQGSEKYRSKLRSLEDQFVMPEEIPDDCYEQMPIPQKIAQRISFLEDRLEGCGGAAQSQPCPYAAESALGGGYGSGLALRRLSAIQAELMRQKNVIRFMRMRLMDINRQCEGELMISLHYWFCILKFLMCLLTLNLDFMAGPERNNYMSDCSGGIPEEDREVWFKCFSYSTYV